jgi:hypothetical protein
MGQSMSCMRLRHDQTNVRLATPPLAPPLTEVGLPPDADNAQNRVGTLGSQRRPIANSGWIRSIS